MHVDPRLMYLLSNISGVALLAREAQLLGLIFQLL